MEDWEIQYWANWFANLTGRLRVLWDETPTEADEPYDLAEEVNMINRQDSKLPDVLWTDNDVHVRFMELLNTRKARYR